MNVESLRNGILTGDQRSLARAISLIERRGHGYRDLIGDLYQHRSNGHIIGITGSPGTGKSTLVGRLIREYRNQDLRVGIIAIDPTSPFTGGAILGDRIRMDASQADPEVFIRSLSTGGALGGLTPTTDDVITLFQAFSMDRIIVETVGAGQNEVDIVQTADTVAVVCQPTQGDDIQLLKAGILEIGDLFVLNKADLSGADRMYTALEQMVAEAGHHGETSNWNPPILQTVATDGTGIESLDDTIAEHERYLTRSGEDGVRQRRRYQSHLQRILRDTIERKIETALTRVNVEDVEGCDPYTIANDIVKTGLIEENHESQGTS